MKSIIFWDMTPCSPLSFNQRFGGTHHLHLQGRRNKFSKHLFACFFLAELISSTLKMEAISSFETSVDTTDCTASYPRRWYSSLYLSTPSLSTSLFLFLLHALIHPLIAILSSHGNLFSRSPSSKPQSLTVNTACDFHSHGDLLLLHGDLCSTFYGNKIWRSDMMDKKVKLSL
jgi:hypothetical protein